MCGANSSTLLCGIAIFVVFADIGMSKSLQPQGILKGGFHRLNGKRHAEPFEVKRCGEKCTQSLTCRSFINDPRSSECKLFHDVKSARRHSVNAYIRTVPCPVDKNYVWRDYPQVCFTFEADTLMSWRDAEIDCQSDHGHLVKLDSQKLRLEVPCPVDKNYVWRDYPRGCFKLEADTLMSWRDAEIDCQSDHGHLVKLDSLAKNELIVKFAQEFRLEVGMLVGFNIGAKDVDGNGHWTWYDNTPVSCPKWGPNEPSGDGYCAQILSIHSYRWNDVNCSDFWGYICEIPM